jgi:MYXO-CTERM domain-containing protein
MALLLALGDGRQARAHNAGISSVEFSVVANGCLNCHGGGTMAPTVALTPSKTTLAALESITLSITVSTPNTVTPAGGVPTPGAAGFNLRTDKAGAFASGSANTRTIAGPNATSEATHTMRTEGEPATFSVSWTPAAGVTGDVTFTLWGNAVNENGNNQGDLAAMTTRTVTVTAPCTPSSFYRDVDGDGYGAGTPTSACTAPTGFVATAGDCNDALPAIHPGASESCNGVDDDCDGSIDDGLALLAFYPDADADGFGSAAAAPKMVCSLAQAGAGFVVDHADCNDGNPAIKPTAVESCNGVDDDCDGVVDGTNVCPRDAGPDADGGGAGDAKDGGAGGVRGAAGGAGGAGGMGGAAGIGGAGTLGGAGGMGGAATLAGAAGMGGSAGIGGVGGADGTNTGGQGGAVGAGPGGTGGSPPPDAATGEGVDTADSGVDVGTIAVLRPSSNEGCGCHVGQDRSPRDPLSVVTLIALALWLRRRRERPDRSARGRST